MKILDKINLILFSTIILIISLLICVISFGWLQIDLVKDTIDFAFTSTTGSNILLGVSIVLILFAIKSIFFNSFSTAEKGKDGILLENDNGKLLVSKDTIENLSNAVVKSFQSAENSITKVDVDQENNVKIYITLFVYPEVVIKELSSKLQIKIKETVKKSLDLDVKEVNIRIKNIAIKKEPTIKE